MNRQEMENFVAEKAKISKTDATDVLDTLIEEISSSFNRKENEEEKNMFGKESMKDKKSIVIYFSRADENYSVGYIDKGNTEVIAEYIRDVTGADLFKVEPSIPYAKDYNSCIEEAKERQANHNAPIVTPIPDISTYEVIYIGTPVYWGVMPEEMVTALNTIAFTGKVIRPFVTHEGSGLASIPNQIRTICVGATILDALEVRGSDVYSAKDKVQEWI